MTGRLTPALIRKRAAVKPHDGGHCVALSFFFLRFFLRVAFSMARFEFVFAAARDAASRCSATTRCR